MGLVHTEITLENVREKVYASIGYIKEEEVHSFTVEALVDTGSTDLCISEEMSEKLGLKIIDTADGRLANNSVVTHKITEPVKVIWKDRSATCDACVLPGIKRPLLGAIPMEGMNMTVCPRTGELEVHNERWFPTFIKD